MLKGKRLSILGDSVSTYQGVSDDTSANSTLYYNPYFYRDPYPLESTYWHILISELGLELCVNNSWSGGLLSGKDDPDSGVNRADRLSKDNGESPDIIIVFMGLNDVGRRISESVFAADYEKTLATLKKKYPSAYVCCVNLPDRDARLKKSTELFNSAIESAANSMGDKFFVADLFHSRLNNDFYYMNTIDGLHPDPDGMRFIANIVKDAILKHVK